MVLRVEPTLYMQPGGTKEKIVVLPYYCNTQITIGGRGAGTVKLRVRPFLPSELELPQDNGTYLDDAMFEYLPDADINLATLNGKRTYTIPTTHLSNLMIDDSANSGPFWVSVWQFTQEK